MGLNFKLFLKIVSVEDFWKWSMGSLAVNLRASKWYNSKQPYGLAGFMNDFTSRMLGYATFRQVRVLNSKIIKFSKIFDNFKTINKKIHAKHLAIF